jgi:hypothetical protein
MWITRDTVVDGTVTPRLRNTRLIRSIVAMYRDALAPRRYPDILYNNPYEGDFTFTPPANAF